MFSGRVTMPERIALRRSQQIECWRKDVQKVMGIEATAEDRVKAIESLGLLVETSSLGILAMEFQHVIEALRPSELV